MANRDTRRGKQARPRARGREKGKLGRRMGTCVIARPPRHYTVLLYLYCVSNRLAMNLYFTVCPVDFIVLPMPGRYRRKISQNSHRMRACACVSVHVSVCIGVWACPAARTTKYILRWHLVRHWRGFLVTHTSEWRNLIVSSTGLTPNTEVFVHSH